ncbi:MAG TPA: type 4a pilus biogenesis protein PilO [Solirubrobacterales bacterium]|nr:type 4a pilus biogenesis protein PilO [Solirubrobacterales bacterium]
MSSANRLVVSILVIAALAIGFWVLALSPKREKVDELGTRVDGLNLSLAEAQSRAEQAAAAKREFPADYRQLVVLGQAVPASDETSSLLVELNQVATDSDVEFESIQLTGTSEAPPPEAPVAPPAEAPATAASPAAVPAAATVPPTEAAASLLPLGATIGPAGLGVMPYNLAFSGTFFQVADFIDGIDTMVDPGDSGVVVDGRLVTLDGFSLSADPELDFPHLDATFAVTTYVTPPDQGIVAGASPTAPPPVSAAPAAEEASETSETVAAR